MDRTFKPREELIASNPLEDFCHQRGIELSRRVGSELYGLCPLHEDSKPSFRVNIDKQVWRCDPCDCGGSIVDLMMKLDGIPLNEAMAKLSGETEFRPNGLNGTKPAPKPQILKGTVVKEYNYTDASGKLLFQVVRMEPKDFLQRRPLKDGGWSWKLDGVTRVLYNLPKIKEADFVWVVEGEKDADLLNSARQVATTNAGGARKWEDQYSEQLSGKDVLICGDNDAPGQEHVKMVQEKIAPFARSVRVIKIPYGYKDVSDYCASFPKPGRGISDLLELAGAAEVTFQGKAIPVRTMEEMETRYREFAKQTYSCCLNLGHWLPSLSYAIRPLVPGEMACIVADTGVGKTMLLQNIAIKAQLPTLLFEIELPDTLTFERFAGIATKKSGRSIHEAYRADEKVTWQECEQLLNISVCAESRLTPSDIERIINGAGIKTGRRPMVVMLDYVQLIRGAGKSRYETMSTVAEELKVIAKATNTILIIASQIARKDEGEIGLHDAKDSGSIENSCGLVLGAWRDGDDKDRMMIKVLKNTKGHAGRIIPCRIFDSLLVAEETNQA